MFASLSATAFYRIALNAGRSSQEKVVRPSAHLSNACIVTKQKKDLSRFLYFYDLLANYVTVVEVVKYYLTVPVFNFWP